MLITARILRPLLPVLVGAGVVLAACSSDSDDPPAPANMGSEPGEGGSDSGGSAQAGEGPTGPGEGGNPSAGTAGTAGRGGSGGGAGTTGTGGTPEPEPGTGGTPAEVGGGGAGGSTDPGPTEPTAGFLRGKDLVEKEGCATCHQTDFGGVAVFANITPDKVNGIGAWTDDEVKRAIREGVDKEGATLCAQMKKYAFNDEELSDVVEFLRGIPAVTRKTNDCQ